MSTENKTAPPAGTSTPLAPILYNLYYRQGNNPHPQFTFFYLSSKDMQTVTSRAKRHCEVMNYRFVYVRPAIIDLDKEENFLQREQ